MKPVFYCVILCVLSSSWVHATNYYLSNSGSDSNSGTQQSAPWQTIAKLNTITLQPGDSVFFMSENIFRGQINVLSGGNAASPIYFGTYGGTFPAVISGAELVSPWSIYSGYIYEADFLNAPMQFFSNDDRMTVARFPDSGFFYNTAGLGYNGFEDSTLTQPAGYWNGSNVCLRTADLLYEVHPVGSFSGDSVLFSDFSINYIPTGFGFYFFNIFSALDSAGEWYYDTAQKKIFFYAPGGADPNSLTNEASVYGYGINIQNGGGFISIINLQFEDQSKAGIVCSSASNHISIGACRFLNQDERGIDFTAGISYSAITGSAFKNICGRGIDIMNAVDVTISDDSLFNTGLISDAGLLNQPQWQAIRSINSDSIFISGNIIDSTGGSSLEFSGKNDDVEKNIFQNAQLALNSGASVVLSGVQNSNDSFSDNFILDTKGENNSEPTAALSASGIYLNYSCPNCSIHHNTVVNASGTGIFIDSLANGISLKQNLVYGCVESQLKFTDDATDLNPSGNSAIGNVFYSLNEASDVVKLVSRFEDFIPAQFDSNYYFNPYDFYAVKTDNPLAGDTHFTYILDQWRLHSNADANSKNTFFFRNRYQVLDSVGSNLIANGQFTNNLDNWVDPHPDSLIMLLDNSTPLDYGCMKLQMEVLNPLTLGFVYSNNFVVDSGAFYSIGISNWSVKEGNVEVKVKKNGNDYVDLVTPRYFPFDILRHDYRVVEQVKAPYNKARFDFEMLKVDSMLWVDNASVIPVDVLYEPPTKKSRLFLNPTGTAVSIDIGDSTFFDLDQNMVTLTVDLPPYSSTIIVFDSSLINSVHEPSASNRFSLFPNPASPGNQVTLSFDHPLSGNIQLTLFDLQGNLIYQQRVGSSGTNLFLILGRKISSGTYLLRCISGREVYISKLVVID